jgi:hypothetical protein
VREGARDGAVGATAAEVQATVVNTASVGNLTVSDVTVTNASDQGGERGEAVTVGVTYSYTPITPIGKFSETVIGPFNISAQAVMRIE